MMEHDLNLFVSSSSALGIEKINCVYALGNKQICLKALYLECDQR